VVGALRGRFSEAFSKLSTLHSKNSFAFAILLGDVFSVHDSSDEHCTDNDAELHRLLRGEISVPLPTYFTVGHSTLPSSVVDRIESKQGEICENLFFLGKKGVLNTSEGIRIVAVGGTSDPNITSTATPDGSPPSTPLLPFYTAADVNTLKGLNHADILISADWPAKVERGSSIIPKSVSVGSAPLAELARSLRPRYHFCPSPLNADNEGGTTFFEREPYRNDISKNETSNDRRLTRFYALGSWGNASKAKALYAFTLDPSAKTPSTKNSTPCPYHNPAHDARGTKRSASPADGNVSFFWGDHTSRKTTTHRQKKNRERPPPPTPDTCFFCLSNPQVEKHLVVSIGSEAYLTTAKGPLTTAASNPSSVPFSAHILIITILHAPTVNAIEDPGERSAARSEMWRYKTAIENMLADRGGVGAVTFEIRRQNGVHAHWQLVPISLEKISQVHCAFDDAAAAMGKSFVEDSDGGDDDNGDAFRYWVSNTEDAIGNAQPRMGKGRARTLMLDYDEYFDFQFGRRALAGVLGSNAAANWRNCVLGVQKETDDALAFRNAFKKWDFSLEE
jgi:hypothetical protein